ncbi:transcription factor [Fusarium heterosporum]|uniref:Transcription factor n=1 Tax=Fusarium heterosporum TaxID=42747 RepID=A0A8H5T9A6_FUSHE|nr:transcription factor [Fusarium heterosporum]
MSAREGRSAKVLSCSNCRTRKIKCDKIQPLCGQCSRFGLDCVFPSRKPTRRAPRPRQSELLDRISRLESIVNQADPAKLKQLDEGDIEALPQPTSLSATLDERCEESEAAAAQTANLETGEQYLSSGFWGNLCAEVEGIRQALNQPSEDDNEDDEGYSPDTLDTGSTGPSGFLLGNSHYNSRHPLTHPPPNMVMRLWTIYTRNVDPLMKILHRPTISRYLQAYVESPTTHKFSPEMNAVIFSIYFCVAVCLTPESCRRQLGESKDVLTMRYRIAVERAFAEADYLSSTKLETLQALTLYTSMMRVHLHDRTSWVLTSLIIRIAQGQNLHRDGDGRRFTPFVAEMRRRLWNFIVVLDIRGSEDRGSDATLMRSTYDTIEPTPIDDDDFGPDSGPLIPKPTPADNVICMCMAMCSGIFGFLAHPQYSATGELEHFSHTEEELISYIRQLETRFIHTAQPSHLPSVYACEIARIVILKLWLNIQYPFNGGPAPDRPRVSKETMLRTAISIIELRERMTKNVWEDRFAWWSDTYVQWHPLAVALAELCVQTEGELVEKAWTVVEKTFPSSRELIADTSKGSLWRPIKKLLRKARAARTEALLKRMDFDASMNLGATASFMPSAMDGMAQPLQYDTTQQMTVIPSSGPGLTQQYDTSSMDPSILFDPPEILNLDFGMGLEQGVPMEWTYWTEFFNDTQIETSPGSGTGESS